MLWTTGIMTEINGKYSMLSLIFLIIKYNIYFNFSFLHLLVLHNFIW